MLKPTGTHTIKTEASVPSGETLTLRDCSVIFTNTLTLETGAKLIFENCVLDMSQLPTSAVALDLYRSHLELHHCEVKGRPKSADPFQKNTSVVRTTAHCDIRATHTYFDQTWHFGTINQDRQTCFWFEHCHLIGGYDIFVGDCCVSFDHCRIENHRNSLVAFVVQLHMSNCHLSYTGNLLEATTLSLSYSHAGIAHVTACQFENLRAIEYFAGWMSDCVFTDLGYIVCDRDNMYGELPLVSEFRDCQFHFTRPINKFTPWFSNPSLVSGCVFHAQTVPAIPVRFGLIQANLESYETLIEQSTFQGFDTQNSYVILPGTFFHHNHGMATVRDCHFVDVTSTHGQTIQTHARSHDPVHHVDQVHVIQTH